MDRQAIVVLFCFLFLWRQTYTSMTTMWGGGTWKIGDSVVGGGGYEEVDKAGLEREVGVIICLGLCRCGLDIALLDCYKCSEAFTPLPY